MSRVLKPLAIAALIVGAAILTGGISIAPSIAGFTVMGVAVPAVAGGITFTAFGTAMLSTAIGVALSGISQAFVRQPRIGLSDVTRLNLTQIAAAPRKMVLGRTAFAADLRYDEPSGLEQRFVDAIIHLASHRVTSVQELRLGDKLAWTSSGGVQGEFVGFLTIEIIPEAGEGAFHTVNDGFLWGPNTRMTGCATARIRVDRQGGRRAQSPFAGGLPSQVMFVGEGMPLYDPRRDSTVPGGSGPHRAHDQATWQYRDGVNELGSNLALQALGWRLGWRINGVVSCGLGDPVSRLDLEAFAAAANVCDETVTLAGGGTQRRYHGAGLIADNGDKASVEQAFADCVGGWWDDGRGRMGLFCAVNDLAGAVLTLGDDDVLSAVSWAPFPELAETYNVVRGLNPEPTMPANFQPTEYPEVRIPSFDNIDRALNLNLAFIQDKRTPQRLAKQALQRAQYPGIFGATFGTRGWLAKKGRVVRIRFAKLGFANKLFRVIDRTKNVDGTVNLVLREEHASIYAWAAEETAPVVPATPITFDPLNNPMLVTRGLQIGVEDGADVTANAVPTLSLSLETIEIRADFAGTVLPGQLPRSIKATRKQGDFDVSGSTFWSIVPVGCTATISATGTIDVTACTSAGHITVSSRRDGLTLTFAVVVLRPASPPPQASGGAGGAASDSTINSVSSASYGSANAGPLTVTIGPAGSVSLTAPLDFTVDPSFGTGNFGLRGKWQRRAGGGAWTDVSAERLQGLVTTVGTAQDGRFVIMGTGFISVDNSITGLTPGTVLQFQLLLRTDSGTRTRFCTGTAAAVPS